MAFNTAETSMMTEITLWHANRSFDGTSDLEERLNNYITTERNNAVDKLAKEEGLDVSVLNHYLSEYDYLQKEQPEIIQEALKRKTFRINKKTQNIDKDT